MNPATRFSIISRLFTVVFVMLLTVLPVILASCSEKDDPLEPSISISGRVTNNSGESGTVYVEVTRTKKAQATPAGYYLLPVTKDFYVDSLYAYVDVSGNAQCDQYEPYGFLHSSSDPGVALPIHVRDQSVPNVNIEIPFSPRSDGAGSRD